MVTKARYKKKDESLGNERPERRRWEKTSWDQQVANVGWKNLSGNERITVQFKTGSKKKRLRRARGGKSANSGGGSNVK